ncbi:TRAP transporter substrate-binding protein [Schinkia azotoformans]|uniref:TRAP dicarboxylate transporter subunit DctP n=1 Tax=Schinkia azotoformans LMG 9581 TaxID=1131731 RepID=K6C115_SCHAZ|nr:TRAP transporter substrate-binding protein [Schinkia azotoformans]EKN64855.1 TRAP dicarboxylate transporter subunit DctP [Schinkia azotoformans LMG 9581]MEC1640196.1 TRAP transporter substrate-binding protein [Schinkia azotoformans]MEC1720581.1 TRAP transporter substrate-binding protein [Schinkia azotoformans]MEC1945378.1 TRAP transporter substrate-binding protein [Schinkia azotoformans]MED4353932.1 TRAP transporter substrate-binding protein [Schinkia azotoformans]
MKKWLMMMLAAVLMVGILAGCGARSQQSTSKEGGEAGGGASDEKIIIKFSHVVAENTPKGQAAEMFKQLAEEYTNGKVEIQVFPNSQLYKDEDVLAAVQQNNVQLAAPSTSVVTKLYPQWTLFDLPFIFKDEAGVQAAMESPEIGGKLFTMLEEQNLLGLAMWDNGFKQTHSNKKIVAPADFKGQKLRVMSSKVLEAQFKSVGANPTPMAFGEVYSALEQGVIDGGENTISNVYSQKMHEVQKYITMSNHGYLGYAVITNSDFWNGLPEDVRTQLQKALDETTAWVRDNSKRVNDEQLAEIKASGKTEIIELSEEERQAWVDAMTVIYSEFEGEIGKDLIDAAKALW